MAISFGVGAAQPLPPVEMDQHVIDEGQYWVNGVDNDAERYTFFCGVVRKQDAGDIPSAKTMAVTTANDLDYIYAMAGTKMCAEAVRHVIEATANAIASPDPMSFSRVMINNAIGIGE